MARFERGKPIRARDLNQTTGEAQTGANPSATRANVHVGPRGHHIHIPKSYVLPDGAMWAQYTSAQTAGQYNLVEYYDTFSTHTGKIVLKVRKPQIPGNSSLAVTLKGVGQNEIVPVQVEGAAMVWYYYDPSQGSLSNTDNRLGTLGNSLYAHVVPLSVLEYIGEAAFDSGSSHFIGPDGGRKQGTDDEGYLRYLFLVPIRIIGRNCDVYAVGDSGGWRPKTCEVFYFDNNYTVDSRGNGMTRIKKA